MFLVQSTSAGEGLNASDVDEDFFKEMVAAGNKVMVDEVKLPIVYVALPRLIN